MNKTESRAAFALAGILALRMLGLFMIYPVFAVYARHLTGATAATIGMALGIYGLTQALFQLPFGMLSDRIGRKRVITVGLLIFASGSVVAALAHTIYGVILGRTLQGAGAVGSVVLALGADLTREEHRTKAMAVMGMTIGLSFGVAVVLGPIFNSWIGVSGIFWATAGMALVGLVILHLVVPRPLLTRRHRDTEPVPAMFRRVLSDPELLRLDFGIFALHAMLTASFLGLPLILREAGLSIHHQWYFYLPVLVISVVAMVPLIIIGETRGKMKPVFLGAVLAIGLAQAGLVGAGHSVVEIMIALVVFFTAFNLMEASLPSLISKAAPADAKGTAMGVYSSSQFLGIFVGGAAGGWLHGHFGLPGLYVFSASLAGIWFLLALGMRNPPRISNRLLNVGGLDAAGLSRLEQQLRALEGVREVVVHPEEGVAYLKVDARRIDEARLAALTGVEAEAAGTA